MGDDLLQAIIDVTFYVALFFLCRPWLMRLIDFVIEVVT